MAKRQAKPEPRHDPGPRTIRGRIAGVSYRNDNGTERQAIIRRHCRPGMEIVLRPEPDNKDQLPEEASKDDVEQQELQQALAGDQPDAEQITKDILIVGDRMARSRQRLALNNDRYHDDEGCGPGESD